MERSFDSGMLKRSLVLVSFAMLTCAAASADAPGRGITAPFEQEVLRFIIDHEYAGLRMTELAAGTDATRDPVLNPAEGTAPTPDTEPVTAARGRDPMVLSMARLNNRKQREIVLTAQLLLREWYGVEHAPQIRETDRRKIQHLENTAAGERFDHEFLEALARHHYQGVVVGTRCLVGADLLHLELKGLCRNIVENETNEIELMRVRLCKAYEVCDYQPFADPNGQHGGEEGEPAVEDVDPSPEGTPVAAADDED